MDCIARVKFTLYRKMSLEYFPNESSQLHFRFGRFARQQFADGRQRLKVVAEYLERHRNWHRQQDSDNTPNPSPKHQRDENNQRIEHQSFSKKQRRDEIIRN